MSPSGLGLRVNSPSFVNSFTPSPWRSDLRWHRNTRLPSLCSHAYIFTGFYPICLHRRFRYKGDTSTHAQGTDRNSGLGLGLILNPATAFHLSCTLNLWRLDPPWRRNTLLPLRSVPRPLQPNEGWGPLCLWANCQRYLYIHIDIILLRHTYMHM